MQAEMNFYDKHIISQSFNFVLGTLTYTWQTILLCVGSQKCKFHLFYLRDLVFCQGHQWRIDTEDNGIYDLFHLFLYKYELSNDKQSFNSVFIHSSYMKISFHRI